MGRQVYSREPLNFHHSIPVFSLTNEYTDNYEQISTDHLTSLYQNGTNPFIKEELWIQAENSTIELVRKHAKPGDMILDVGVGLGRLLSHFPNLQRYGMDISFGYLKEAQSKGIEVCYALIEDLPYQPEIFDVVVCTDVLEHVLDLNLACTKILSVLRPEGKLIIRVPFQEDLSQYAAPSCPYKYVHLRNFDQYSLQLLFEKIFGCEVIEMVTAGYVPYGARLKFPLSFPKRDGILRRLLALIKAVYVPAYEALLRKGFDPVEINVVVKKTQESFSPFVPLPSLEDC